jgi:hypothetical protein
VQPENKTCLLAGHAQEMVKSADLSTIDSIVCVSGDGLMVEVVNGLLQVRNMSSTSSIMNCDVLQPRHFAHDAFLVAPCPALAQLHSSCIMRFGRLITMQLVLVLTAP